MTLEILYQDEWLVAVNKPSGWLVHRSWLDRDEKVVVMQTVRDQIGQHVFTAHRLDRPTSGVLLMGLSSEAGRLLSQQFEQHQIQKRYHAIVRGWLTETLERQLAPLERSGQLRRLGYVPQEELPLIYSGAHAFAYPSLYEGFGLPVLEAMSCGIPVLTTDRASLPEVAGDAALLVNPEDVDAITAGLERLLTDHEWRTEAIQRGLQQAGRFSWTRCIKETITVYQQALAG